MHPARKKRILDAHDGKCWRCGVAFKEGERITYDHKCALARGGSDDDENIGPSHTDTCDKLKTYGTKALRLGSDIFEIAKTKRLAKGPKETKGRKLQGRGFSKGQFKKKLNGEVVRRDD
jgi:hypothetical protein